MDSRTIKSVATKGIRLQSYLNAYHRDGEQKEESVKKFVAVWGNHLAAHFLLKYDDAEELIWALDSNNLELFVSKF